MPLPKRKKSTQKPSSLPKEFLHTVASLFEDQFKKITKGSTFLVYGDLYPDEVIFCASLSNPKSLRAASIHLSADLPKGLAESPEKLTEILKGLVDVAASWFSQSLEGGEGLDSVLSEMADMDPNWQEVEWENATIFVKINKDNYTLEKAAKDFLKKAGFEEEDITDEEIEEFLEENDPKKRTIH
jgi:hypothetical protein